MHDLERYLNVRSAYGASMGPDGTVAFLMDTTGTPQIWTLDDPAGWPDQRTFYDERVTFCSFSPERRELAFGMDEGGDEFTQLFSLDLDSGDVHPLTDTPDAIHYWGGWSHDGDRIAFAANRRDESVFDVYVQGRDEQGEATDLVYEGDGWLALAGWSPDDDCLLVTEHTSSFDKDLYVLHLDSRDLEHVTPHDGDVRYNSPSWGPDGEAIYCCTDRDSDTLRLERLDLDTGDFAVVEDGGEWNVDGIALDDETGRLAFSRNVDGYTDITVGALTGATEYDPRPAPDLPEGTAGGVSFGPDGETFALSASSRTNNTNVHRVAFESGETEQWTRASTAGIPRSSFREPELVHYETFDGRAIPAYFTLPAEEHRPSGGVPVIVDIHGGPESQRRPSFSGLTQYFLSRGYAVFEPNVRGSTGYGTAYTHLDDVEKRMDSVQDIRAAVEWLTDHAAVDPDRIVAKGGSYGGFVVLAALTEYPDLWAAGVDSVGIANFVTFLENTGAWRQEHREAEYGSLEDDRAFLESISPLNHADRITAPLFVLHGANDPRVPVGEAEQIVEEVQSQGVPVEKLIFEDEGHGISKLENRIAAYTAVVDFLDRHV
ncbi:S9 family peptidase [Halorientalis pallida]|uniref:Acyl-peptide hydrolase n=1 Tax=Halorientalis pallida TaxID=2479928 RepID=A0A498L051_9EURY|nr:S9 family peptidase [Halorientalis pallida]RXK48424.1 S9 family peptidase [Halorientalis pallida]